MRQRPGMSCLWVGSICQPQWPAWDCLKSELPQAHLWIQLSYHSLFHLSEASGSELDLGEFLVLHELMKYLFKQRKPDGCNPSYSNSSPHFSSPTLDKHKETTHWHQRTKSCSRDTSLAKGVCSGWGLHVWIYLQSWKHVSTGQSSFQPLPVLFDQILISAQYKPCSAPKDAKPLFNYFPCHSMKRHDLVIQHFL